MRLTPSDSLPTEPGKGRTLIVADWKADPRAVVSARAEHAGDASVALLVPARLHGIDWVGDPYANVPCARRALAEIAYLLEAADLPVHSADLGDHDPVAAVLDAVLRQRIDRILVLEPNRRARPRLMDLAHRVRRATDLPVIPVAVGAVQRRHSARPWLRLWRGECPAPRRTSNVVRPAGV